MCVLVGADRCVCPDVGGEQKAKKGRTRRFAPTTEWELNCMKYNPDIHHRRSIQLKAEVVTGYKTSKMGKYWEG